jgi:hypothetical protein
MKVLFRAVMRVATVVLVPSAVLAQGSITGSVRDTTGAVLPGVTVEASSPALIERARSVVTDSQGAYTIVDLRPGTYVVGFTLAGFSTVKREGIELTGTFTAIVNADLKVGAVSETITVSGESPVVDVVNAKQQTVLSKDSLAAIPTARLYHSVATLVPGVSLSGTQDVGGIAGPTTVTFNMRGGPGNEGRLTVDGLSLGASLNGTGVSYTVADVGNAQEIVFTTAGQLGEAEVGGPSMNLVPRQGGNQFTGTFFANGATESFQSSNYTDAIEASGLAAPQQLLKIWDTNVAVGGPIRQNRLWFFTAARYQGNRKAAPNFVNANADDVTKWTYVASTTQGKDAGTWKNVNGRLTWQASERNKFNFFWDEQRLCTSCLTASSQATVAPEAHYNNHAPPRVQQVTWSSPWTNRLLLEAGVGTNLINGYGTRPNISNYSQMIPVVENCLAGCAANGGIPGLAYRSTAVSPFVGAYEADSQVYSWRASATQVSGQSTFKVGYIGQQIVNHFATVTMNDQWLAYTFNNGVPFSFTQYAGPGMQNTHVQTHAIYAQNQWTIERLTLSGAVRYDRTAGFFPEQTIGPNPFVPTAVLIPKAGGTKYNDITPRVGVSYDVFGNGKTAVKVNVGKFLAAADGSSITGGLTNPLNTFQTNTGARTWNDVNKNFVVDCRVNGVIPNAAVDNRSSGGDFCGQGNLNFGNFNTPTTTYDPAVLHGWGVRPYDWNFGAQVQQEIMPRVSVNVGYFRRVFGNFLVTNNRAQNTFGQFQVTAPVDSRLPDGDGQVIGTLYNVDPSESGKTDNLVNLSDNLGLKQIRHWNGVEMSFSARVGERLTFQGGTSTGRTSTDSCAVRAILPESANVSTTASAVLNPYCHVDPPFKTQARGLASYLIPKIDVLVSSAFQSVPGGTLAANHSFPNSVVALSLGRNLSGNAQNAVVNLVAPGTLYGDRINQIDFRAGKVLRMGRLRTQFSVDLYNALNSSAIQTYNETFIVNGAWLTPTLVLPARFAKLTAQIDF